MNRRNGRKARAVFLDRDGVINEILFHEELGLIETPFHPRQFHLKKGIAEAIRHINRLGLKAVVVSNQPGVAMRRFSARTLAKITDKMIRSLRQKGARIDAVYYCLHHPVKGVGKLKKKCSCRKPRPGLLRQAAKDMQLDLKNSYMIGDSITDVQAGLRAGCKTFLTAHLKCDLCELMARRGVRPHYLAKDLQAVVKTLTRLES